MDERSIGEGSGVRFRKNETGTVSVRVFGTACFYLVGRHWKQGPGCKSAPSLDKFTAECHCYIEAPYTAQVSIVRGNVYDYVAPDLSYEATNMIPGFPSILLVVLGIYYCYWAFFQDKLERDCVSLG
ncbi:hypothetical protein ElyMa_001783400 [Elysia marginata]|uniref:Uncharacterized protein n=1 Tax=Elysia marginata TaxID=1093978 RepID=A0AAV4EET9_9GAST|nr:hypothetical protein ElyMa_001783400 [Elysia marginata]